MPEPSNIKDLLKRVVSNAKRVTVKDNKDDKPQPPPADQSTNT